MLSLSGSEAMKMKTWKTVLLSIAMLTVSAAGGDWVLAQSSGPATQNPPVRRALLIGINKYKGVPQLRGSINDVETMRQILISRFGFTMKNIALLTDEAATRQGILSALERFVKETNPQDIAYIHYSGHGSLVEGQRTLVPQDGRTGEIPDIVDQEFKEIIGRLRAQTTIVVLDSCNSGTATRGVEVRTRSVPPDTRLALYPRTRQVVPLSPFKTERALLMAAAPFDQLALDASIEGRPHGVFTYALARSLGAVKADASAREVEAAVKREYKRIAPLLGRSVMPEPQVEGADTRLSKPILPPVESGGAGISSNVARLAWVEVQVTGPNTALLLNAVNLGGFPGSSWAVYAPNEINFVPGRALALAVVTEVKGRDALARLELSGGGMKSGGRAVLYAPPPPVARVPIFFRDVPSQRRDQLAQAIRQRLGDVEIVGPGTFARWVVDLQGDTLRLYGADGSTEAGSFSVSSAQWADNAALVMSRGVTAGQLLSMDNASSRLRLEARVVAHEQNMRGRGIITVSDLQESIFRMRRPGEARTPENSLQLEIRASEDSYLTIVDVDSQGGVNVLFPNPYSQKAGFYPEGKVRGGETLLLPDSLQSGNQAKFHWDYSPPPGSDTIRIFASTDLDTAKTIRQYITGSASGKPDSKKLEQLRTKLARVATRGLITVPDDPAAVTPSGGPATGTAPGPLTSESAPQGLSSSAGQTRPRQSDWTATSLSIMVTE